MKRFDKEIQKLDSSSFDLSRSRINWSHVTQDLIESEFSKVILEARSNKYPFSLYCAVNDATENEVTVQLSSGANKTGVIEKVKTAEMESVTCEIEKGSALVASFGSTGSVAFIIYPYKSERYSRTEDNIILHSSLSPDSVNEKLIKSCIANYLFYIRCSSIYGAHSFKSSFRDKLRMNWLLFRDIRNRRKIYRKFYTACIEWGKIIGAGIAGYIVAILTKGA
ncbi:hypothetical protein [Psychromonas aquatilis]|uniref:Uncharacterized protein n=1 Tax=Psychromonas aquatilis TaxID=2005072 RepID=A0ABU9GUG8_9GAMM